MDVVFPPRTRRATALSVCALLLLPLCAVAGAGAEPTECDRLAAHPSDPDKVTDGVSSGAVRGWNEAAIWACREALRRDPESARLHYQLGRSLFYAGEQVEGLRHLTAAASAKYRQAEFVLGLLHTDGVPEVLSAEPCKALELWQDAASRGHFASRVALGRDWARGRYRDCPSAPDAARVDAWLAEARLSSSDYYQQLLIDWTREVIATTQ